MALKKSELPISFEQGLSTKIDDKQQVLGAFSVLENVIFDSLKSFKKRSGYDKIDLTQIDETSISNAASVSTFNNELLLHTDSTLFSYAQNIERFINKGSLYNVFPESTVIHRDNRQQKNIDVITVGGVTAFAYDDSVQGVTITIFDQSTGVRLLHHMTVSGSGVRPKLGNIENTVYISYIDGTALKYRKVNILFPTTLSTEATIVTNVNAVKKYDVASLNNKIIYAYQDTGAEIVFVSLDSDDTTSSTFTVTGESASGGITLSIDSQDRLATSYYNGTSVKFLIRDEGLSYNHLAPTVIETIASVTNTINIEFSSTTNLYNIYYEVQGAGSYLNFVRGRQISQTGTFAAAAALKFRGVCIASKLFIEEGADYFLGIHPSTLQSTYFLCKPGAITGYGSVVSRVSSSLAGSEITDNGPCAVSPLGDKRYLIGSQIRGKSVTDTGTFYSLLGVNQTIFDFDLEDNLQTAQLGQNLHISSGFLYMYDGYYTYEHGFHLYPEFVSAGTNTLSGGSMSNGTYQYVAVYMWTDRSGQEHRSAPSIPISVTTAAGGSAQTQEIIVPNLRLTDKSNVIIELYRTENLGDIFYKVTSTTAPTYNTVTTDTTSIVDSLSDASLITREILYTTGGILENFTSPASSIITTFNNRLVLAGLEDPNKIQYSKIRFESKPVEFNDALVINVNSDGGDIKALFAYDDKLLIFKEQAIFFISGDGPNNAGQQDTFTEPELVSSDVGCVDRNSVILIPDGVMFKSHKGIYLLDRGLGLHYIGAPVEGFNDYRITASDIISKNNQVRFITDNSIALVYDYITKQWTTFTNHGGLASVVLGTDYYFLKSDGTLYKQNDSRFDDNGTSVKMRLSTGWMSFVNMQKFKRVYRMEFLGKFYSEHKLRIRAAYDFNDSYIHEKLIDTNDFIDTEAYGEDGDYGDGSPYGGSGNVYQLRLDFKKQKCQSIKLEISDVQSGTELGRGAEFSNMLFVVGNKNTEGKINANKQYGTA